MIALLGDDVPRSARALRLRQSWRGLAVSRKHLYISLRKKKNGRLEKKRGAIENLLGDDVA
jgi:hypothetical protein